MPYMLILFLSYCVLCQLFHLKLKSQNCMKLYICVSVLIIVCIIIAYVMILYMGGMFNKNML